FRRSGLRLYDLATRPNRPQPFSHQDVAGAARIALTDVHLLVSDTDDAVAGHLPGDPVVASPFRLADLRGTRREAAGGRAIVQRSMGSLGVVALHPFIHGLLGGRDVLEHLPGVELQPQRLV